MSQYHMSVAYRKLDRLADAMECCEVLFFGQTITFFKDDLADRLRVSDP